MSAKTKKIEDMTRELVLAVKLDEISIYHIEYLKEFGNYYLRVYIDKDGGVGVNDCEVLSRALSEKLDEREDEIKENYILEVCSPGIDRALHTDEHYEAAIGEEVYIKTMVKIEGAKEHIGELISFDQDEISIKVDDNIYSIKRDKITKANIYFAY